MNRGASWSYEETITLINIWSDTNIQEEFEKSRTNAPIFDKVANDRGWVREKDGSMSEEDKVIENEHLFQK